MTTPGELRHRVTIQHFVTGEDEWGYPIEYWDDLLTCWAKVEGLKGQQLYAAAQTAHATTHRVTVRYRRDKPIKAGMRLVHEGVTYEITAALDREGTRRWLELECRELVP